MTTVSPYWQRIASILEKQNPCSRNTPRDDLLMQRIAQLESNVKQIGKQVSKYGEKIDSLISLLKHSDSSSTKSVQIHSRNTCTSPSNQATTSHSSISNPSTQNSNSSNHIQLEEINPRCKSLQATLIAGLSPPIMVSTLSQDQLNQIRQICSSPVNFAVRLFRLCYTPLQRMKMSSTGTSKGPIKHKKRAIPHSLLTSIIDISKSIVGQNVQAKTITEAIDTDNRQIFWRAKRCQEQRLCDFCKKPCVNPPSNLPSDTNTSLPIEHCQSNLTPFCYPN